MDKKIAVQANNEGSERNEAYLKSALISELSDYLKPSLLFDLPPCLEEYTEMYEPGREQDIAFLSLVGFSSCCFPKLTGILGRKTYCSNLYTYIIGPPASGKGVAAETKILMQDAMQEVLMYLKGPNFEEMDRLIISGNSSQAAMMKSLSENLGHGCIFASEGHTINQVVSQDWGDSTTIMRDSFQHDEVSANRVGESGNIVIQKPHLTIHITGTEDQAIWLLKNIPNGTYSRFLIYRIVERGEYKSQSPYASHNKNHFDTSNIKHQILFQIRLMLKQDTLFTLTESQYKVLDYYVETESNRQFLVRGNDISASILRSGIIVLRMAMILTAYRMNELDLSTQLECSDEDFMNALIIMRYCTAHSMQFVDTQDLRFASLHENARVILNTIPLYKPMKASEIITLIESQGIDLSDRTIKKYLPILVEQGFLKQPLKNKAYTRIK